MEFPYLAIIFFLIGVAGITITSIGIDFYNECNKNKKLSNAGGKLFVLGLLCAFSGILIIAVGLAYIWPDMVKKFPLGGPSFVKTLKLAPPPKFSPPEVTNPPITGAGGWW